MHKKNLNIHFSKNKIYFETFIFYEQRSKYITKRTKKPSPKVTYVLENLKKMQFDKIDTWIIFMQIVHIDTGNLTSIRTTILSFLYLATILGLVVAVSYSKVVLLSSIHITVDTGGYFASYSHCFFGFRRRQGTSRLSSWSRRCPSCA